MDKSEYRAKLDQITALVNAGDYQNAQTIVDEVDWRRVKSARTLCMVSEIYEANERLLDSRKVLELAYKRALVKTVAYRLVEVCLKLNDLNAAEDYYDDFADLAPMDNSKYILKYKIHRAKGDALAVQIKALEDYKEREYTEPWAYELAKLYSQNGNKDACVEACDDLILWFSEGPYVLKAMELKKKYVPLSPSQHEKYKKEIAAKAVKATVPSFIKPAAEPAKPIEASVENAEKDEKEEKEESKIISAEEAIEKMDAAASTTVQSDSGIKLSFGKVSAGAAKATLDPSRMQSQLADSIRNVFAGINNKGTVQLDTQATEIEEKYDNLYQAEEDMSGYEIKDLEPETSTKENVSASDVVLSVTSTEEAKNEDDQIAGQMSFEDYAKKESEFDFEALFAETTNALAMELASGTFEKEKVVNTEEEADKVIEEEIARIVAEVEVPVEEPVAEELAIEESVAEEPAAEEPMAEEPAAEEPVVIFETEVEEIAVEEPEKTVEEEFSEEENPLLYEKETDETLGITREFDFKKEDLKRTIVISEESSVPEEPVEEAVEEPQEINVEEISERMEEHERANELEAILVSENEEPGSGVDSIDLPNDFEIAMQLEETENIQAEESKNTVSPDEISEDLITDPEKVVLPDESRKELKFVPVEPRPLTDEEKEIFTYFSRIPGLGEQISMAISDVHNHAGDKTSKGGNFLVIGRQGSGKTRLYESMVLAICKDLGMDAAKNAKIVARDFNHKDPAAVVAKLSGGFLAIEGAGELSDEAAEKLAQAMEFRTDSLVVVLEDEKEDLMNMLAKHPNLAEKFTSTIKIPVFTNDELVAFARIYAQDQGYRMDEMGILALYTKIGDNQKDAEPVTVGKVKVMMDEAMLHANKGHRKLSRRFSKNAVDEENRIILFEKDFE